jgi:hypothetical protein
VLPSAATQIAATSAREIWPVDLLRVALQCVERRLPGRRIAQPAGPDHGVGHAAGAQRVLALELPDQDVVEHLVQRVVRVGRAHRGHQHELLHARGLRRLDQVLRAAVVDELGLVLRVALAVGAERRDHVGGALDGLGDGGGIAHVADGVLHLLAEQRPGGLFIAHQHADGVALRKRLADGLLARAARGPGDQHHRAAAGPALASPGAQASARRRTPEACGRDQGQCDRSEKPAQWGHGIP